MTDQSAFQSLLVLEVVDIDFELIFVTILSAAILYVHVVSRYAVYSVIVRMLQLRVFYADT